MLQVRKCGHAAKGCNYIPLSELTVGYYFIFDMAGHPETADTAVNNESSGSAQLELGGGKFCGSMEYACSERI